jgi:hypothetical protein
MQIICILSIVFFHVLGKKFDLTYNFLRHAIEKFHSIKKKVSKYDFYDEIIDTFSDNIFTSINKNFFFESNELREILKIFGKAAFCFKNPSCQNFQQLMFKWMQYFILNFGDHGHFRFFMDFSKDLCFKYDSEKEMERFLFLDSMIQSIEYFVKE